MTYSDLRPNLPQGYGNKTVASVWDQQYDTHHAVWRSGLDENSGDTRVKLGSFFTHRRPHSPRHAAKAIHNEERDDDVQADGERIIRRPEVDGFVAEEEATGAE